MLARLLNLLSIKQNEWEGVLYFFLVLLIFSFGASFARSIGMALLINNLGSDKLPIMMIVVDLMVMLGSMVYAHYTKKVSGIAILAFFFLATTLFTVFIQLLMFVASQGHIFNWIYGLFFVGFFFFYILISIHIGSVIASYFTAVQVKRVTSVIHTGLPIGGALGGSTLVVMLNIFHLSPEHLVLVLGMACLGSLSLLRMISNRLTPVRTGHSDLKSNKGPVKEMIMAFKYIMGSKLMIFMSLGLIAFVIGNKLLEYQYQAIIYPSIFPDVTQRTTFFATYEMFANIAWLFIQLFLTARIVVSWGVGASNLLHPVLTAVASLALFIYFYSWYSPDQITQNAMIMLGLAVLTQFVNQEMRGALRTPANNLLFNAIPPNQWGTNKAFLNGIVFPMSTVIAGTILIFVSGTNSGFIQYTSSFTDEHISYILPLIVFIVSILGIFAALPQWAAYNEGVFSLLNRDLFGRHADINSANKTGSNNLRKVIEEKIASVDHYNVIAALEMIRVLRLNQFVNQVGNLLLKTKRFEVQEHCINTLAALPLSNSNITYLIEAMRIIENPNVLSLILKKLSHFKSVNFNREVEKLLAHPSPEVFVEACLCLHGHPQYRPKPTIEKKIIERLEKTHSPEKTALYLYALGELRQSRYSDIAIPHLKSVKPSVRLAAFKAYIRMLEGQLEPHKELLLRALRSSDKEMKIAALRALKECHPLEDWTPIIRLLGARDRTLVNESKELLRLNLNICKPFLIENVFSNTTSVQERFEILSLVYSRLSDAQKDRLQRIAHNSLRNFVRLNGLLKIHQNKLRFSKTHELISKVLQEVAENHLLNVLTVITYVSDQNLEFFQRVSRGLLSLSRANQGNALEVLSNAGEKRLSGRVLKFFDERGTDLQGINRIHITLFNKPLDVNENNYEKCLLALNHDMLRACLHYIQKEKIGRLKLARANRRVRELLIETTVHHSRSFY